MFVKVRNISAFNNGSSFSEIPRELYSNYKTAKLLYSLICRLNFFKKALYENQKKISFIYSRLCTSLSIHVLSVSISLFYLHDTFSLSFLLPFSLPLYFSLLSFTKPGAYLLFVQMSRFFLTLNTVFFSVFITIGFFLIR